MSKISGGKGTSMADAIVITGVNDNKSGVPEVYAYLAAFFPGHLVIGQRLLAEHMADTSLALIEADGQGNITKMSIQGSVGINIKEQGRIFDRFEIRDALGQNHTIYFDVTSFIGDSERTVAEHESAYAILIKYKS